MKIILLIELLALVASSYATPAIYMYLAAVDALLTNIIILESLRY